MDSNEYNFITKNVTRKKSLDKKKAHWNASAVSICGKHHTRLCNFWVTP